MVIAFMSSHQISRRQWGPDDDDDGEDGWDSRARVRRIVPQGERTMKTDRLSRSPGPSPVSSCSSSPSVFLWVTTMLKDASGKVFAP